MADTGNGGKLVDTTGWVGSFRSIGSLEQSIPVLSDSDLGNVTYESKIRGDLIELAPIECEIYFDPDNPPPIGQDAESWILSFPSALAVPAKITGTGFLISTSTPELVNNEVMMGTFSLQLDGQTGPVFSDAAAS